MKTQYLIPPLISGLVSVRQLSAVSLGRLLPARHALRTQGEQASVSASHFIGNFSDAISTKIRLKWDFLIAVFGTTLMYRGTLVVEYHGWFDLDLESSPGWWAATVAT